MTPGRSSKLRAIAVIASLACLLASPISSQDTTSTWAASRLKPGTILLFGTDWDNDYLEVWRLTPNTWDRSRIFAYYQPDNYINSPLFDQATQSLFVAVTPLLRQWLWGEAGTVLKIELPTGGVSKVYEKVNLVSVSKPKTTGFGDLFVHYFPASQRRIYRHVQPDFCGLNLITRKCTDIDPEVAKLIRSSIEWLDARRFLMVRDGELALGNLDTLEVKRIAQLGPQGSYADSIRIPQMNSLLITTSGLYEIGSGWERQSRFYIVDMNTMFVQEVSYPFFHYPYVEFRSISPDGRYLRFRAEVRLGGLSRYVLADLLTGREIAVGWTLAGSDVWLSDSSAMLLKHSDGSILLFDAHTGTSKHLFNIVALHYADFVMID
jgi:hypothetical protein